MSFSLIGKPWQLALFDSGYDIWFGNNRGTKYSRLSTSTQLLGRNLLLAQAEPDPTSEQFWDWSSEDLAKYDLPAEIEKVLEISQQPKLVYIGYSRGTSQMFLALGMDEDYYLQKVERVVALSPCMYENMTLLRPGGDLDYQGAVEFYEQKQAEGDYTNLVIEGGARNSYKDLLYWEQISLEDRPQKFIPLEQYAAGERSSQAIDLGSIDQMMIVGLAGTQDDSCTIETANRIFSEFGHDNTILRPIPGADHLYFAWVTGDEFNNVLKDAIEGNDATGEVQMMTAGQISSSIFQTYMGLVLVLVLGVLLSILGCCFCCIQKDKQRVEEGFTDEGGAEYQRN